MSNAIIIVIIISLGHSLKKVGGFKRKSAENLCFFQNYHKYMNLVYMTL